MAKVTSKGQVTIPKSVRDDLDLQPGSKLLFIKSGDSWKVISPDRDLTARSMQSREMEPDERERVLRELASKYNVDADELAKEPEEIDVVLDRLQDAFQGVATESGWKSEQDIVDYIRSLRHGEAE